MSRLNTLNKNRDIAAVGVYTTHSSYICDCIGLRTEKPFYKLVELIPEIRARPTLLAVMRSLITHKLWEDIDV